MTIRLMFLYFYDEKKNSQIRLILLYIISFEKLVCNSNFSGSLIGQKKSDQIHFSWQNFSPTDIFFTIVRKINNKNLGLKTVFF